MPIIYKSDSEIPLPKAQSVRQYLGIQASKVADSLISGIAVATSKLVDRADGQADGIVWKSLMLNKLDQVFVDVASTKEEARNTSQQFRAALQGIPEKMPIGVVEDAVHQTLRRYIGLAPSNAGQGNLQVLEKAVPPGLEIPLLKGVVAAEEVPAGKAVQVPTFQAPPRQQTMRDGIA